MSDTKEEKLAPPPPDLIYNKEGSPPEPSPKQEIQTGDKPDQEEEKCEEPSPKKEGVLWQKILIALVCLVAWPVGLVYLIGSIFTHNKKEKEYDESNASTEGEAIRPSESGTPTAPSGDTASGIQGGQDLDGEDPEDPREDGDAG